MLSNEFSVVTDVVLAEDRSQFDEIDNNELSVSDEERPSPEDG
jgi:hypothetical protein